MANAQLLFIVAVAMIAIVILVRLYSILGRRTGNEREPQERFRRLGGAQSDARDNVAVLPERAPVRDAVAAKPNDPVENALLDIKLADRNFETEHFLSGAKKAHELIVTAFANADRETLKPLLSDEVYSTFDQVLKGREARKERVKFTVVGYKDVKIVHAALKGRTAEVTVSFLLQFVSSTTNSSGAVVEGDPANVRDVTDVWTFSRDVGGRDPNWVLVATSGGEN